MVPSNSDLLGNQIVSPRDRRIQQNYTNSTIQKVDQQIANKFNKAPSCCAIQISSDEIIKNHSHIYGDFNSLLLFPSKAEQSVSSDRLEQTSSLVEKSSSQSQSTFYMPQETHEMMELKIQLQAKLTHGNKIMQAIQSKIESKKTILEKMIFALFSWIKEKYNKDSLDTLYSVIESAHIGFSHGQPYQMQLFLSLFENIMESKWVATIATKEDNKGKIEKLKIYQKNMKNRYEQKCKNILAELLDDPIIKKATSKNASKEEILAAKNQIDQCNRSGWNIAEIPIFFDKIGFFSDQQIAVLNTIYYSQRRQ